jgi:hypothetical protein
MTNQLRGASLTNARIRIVAAKDGLVGEDRSGFVTRPWVRAGRGVPILPSGPLCESELPREQRIWS